ncbi:ABC transporter ATP-binding protein [Haloferax larsenii]|uniref:ABC-2 type transport system ATP-binding protein n=1 Tax=Haloferax larsenii TaxID=302484 RepID=A0A1H7L4Z8_HALLR|nr:ABC transporter ATP-binding protein [Haloferax larsenii]SEK93904.1 ABC-2 type transport system ATP-binding protein [Haloferax larsenii]
MDTIKAHSLTKQYGSTYAVQNVDLEVRDGEIFGFLGPNGAGKSTTINMLLDFVRPTSGEVSVLGHNPQQEPRKVRERIGVLPEATGYYGRATARDHIEFAAAMKRAEDNPETILERVGIASDADRPVRAFSKGMRQRLGLGIALVGSPELIILDEPLGGLDPAGAQLLREIVREERDRGATVFFSSHIMDAVESLCDRVGIMNRGELIAVDTVDSLKSATGTHEVIEIEVDETPIEECLAQIEGVAGISIEDNVVEVTCTDSTAKVNAIEYVDADSNIVDISIKSPSLEELFLAVTNSEATA